VQHTCAATGYRLRLQAAVCSLALHQLLSQSQCRGVNWHSLGSCCETDMLSTGHHFFMTVAQLASNFRLETFDSKAATTALSPPWDTAQTCFTPVSAAAAQSFDTQRCLTNPHAHRTVRVLISLSRAALPQHILPTPPHKQQGPCQHRKHKGKPDRHLRATGTTVTGHSRTTKQTWSQTQIHRECYNPNVVQPASQSWWLWCRCSDTDEARPMGK